MIQYISLRSGEAYYELLYSIYLYFYLYHLITETVFLFHWLSLARGGRNAAAFLDKMCEYYTTHLNTDGGFFEILAVIVERMSIGISAPHREHPKVWKWKRSHWNGHK